MNSRRNLLVALCAGALTTSLTSIAQARTAKLSRIGVLSPGALFDAGGKPSALAVLFEALREGLRNLGYAEGQNIAIQARWADGSYNRLPDLATELVDL